MFREALKLLLTTSDVDSESEAEVTSSSECEPILDTGELRLEEEICDTDFFEEENKVGETFNNMDQ